MLDNVRAEFFDPNREGSPVHRLRVRRNEEFRRRFPQLADMRVLDLGGTPAYWRTSGLKPGSLTLINLDYDGDEMAEPWMDVRRGDACAGGFGTFDLVYSNSLIEHVGGHARREQFAEVVQESASNWWVQTPYRYFPIEPHWLFPGLQFLPFGVRVKVIQNWSGHGPILKEKADAIKAVASTELISGTELRSYFPDGEIWFERLAGIPKSLVSLRATD